MTARWPSTRTGKRLAACPGRLPVGGEQERLPDGSLTELRMMTSPEIAVAIEAEATAAAEQRLRTSIAEWREPEPRADMERGWNRALDAVLALLDAPAPRETPPYHTEAYGPSPDTAHLAASPRQGEPVAVLAGLRAAVVAMKQAIPLGQALGPEWRDFLSVTGNVNLWLDRADAALSDPAEPVAPDKEGNGVLCGLCGVVRDVGTDHDCPDHWPITPDKEGNG